MENPGLQCLIEIDSKSLCGVVTMSTGKRLRSYSQTNVFEGKPSSYLLVYEECFAPMIDNEVKLLELGVAKGGSLLMWRDYFPKGTIVGLGLNATELNEPRIHTY